MRDLNLGPETRELVKKYRTLSKVKPTDGSDPINMVAREMALLLERWAEVAWCWPDACPSQICGGPHVKVRYDFDNDTEVIEPANHAGETFPNAKYTIITD